MARTGGHPNIAEIGKKTHFNSLDGIKEKMGSKVFSLRFPERYEADLKSLTKEDRVTLMRSAIMKAIDERRENEQN